MVDFAERAGVRLLWGPSVTGLSREGAVVDGSLLRARWVVGADGGQSAVRRWAGLDDRLRDSRRYGFRRHYRMTPWADFMELHWADGCQLYITPVSRNEVCVVLISSDFRLRLDDALDRFPEAARRLAGAGPATLERGGVSASRRLRAVTRGNVALVGDASGSVDAITGEGLCLLFQHAESVADAMRAGDLKRTKPRTERLAEARAHGGSDARDERTAGVAAKGCAGYGIEAEALRGNARDARREVLGVRGPGERPGAGLEDDGGMTRTEPRPSGSGGPNRPQIRKQPRVAEENI